MPLRGPCAHGPPRPAAIPPPRLPLRGTVAHLTAKGLWRAVTARLGRVCAPWRPLPSARAQCARVNAHPLHLQILLDFGGNKWYNIVSTKRALQPAVLIPQSLLTQTKDTTSFLFRSSGILCFFHLFFASWSASAYSIVTASSEWFKSRCTRSMLPCAW